MIMPRVFVNLLGAFVLGFGVALAPVAFKDFRGKFRNGFREGVSSISADCHDMIPLKYWFVDVNGLFARLSGRRLCNKRYLLNNGMLGTVGNIEHEYIEREVGGVKMLRGAVVSMGAKFFFVQFPGKPDMEGRLVPFGLRHSLTAIVNETLSCLREEGVDVLDLRPKFSLTPEHVERHFFRTDHHWNFETAFAAAGDVSRHICAIAGVVPPEGYSWPLDGSNWERQEVHDCFLGSAGKRTGRFFGGLDDVVYLLPRFSGLYENTAFGTDGKGETCQGGFEIKLDRFFIKPGTDVHESNCYMLYRGMGAKHPCLVQRRLDAPVRLRVAVIGDSFSRPLTSFLSTVFSDVMSVDPRYPCEGVMPLKRVVAFRPDVVALCLNPMAYSTGLSKSGRLVFFEYPLSE